MYNNNPYLNQYQAVPRFQPAYEPMQQQYQHPMQKVGVLQGKSVDSIDVVKATDVPFDGSMSYFPLTDGSAIITKQLQNDGTSKITIFKPVNEQKEKIEYITHKDLENALNDLNLDELDDIKEDIKEIKKQLKKKGD